MNRNSLFVDQEFSKFIFSVLMDVTEEQAAVLTPLELRILRDEKSIKRFADNASMEQKMQILTKLGISIVFLFAKDMVEHLEILKEISYQHNSKETRLDIMKRMKDGKMFALGSREIMISALLSSTNTHHRVFNIDHRHQKLMELAKKRGIGGSLVDKVDDVMATYDLLANLAAANFGISNKIEGLLKCNLNHLKILIALYSRRNIFTTRDELMTILGSTDTPKGFAIVCGDMVKEGYLLRRPKVTKACKDYNSYMIADKGIALAMRYLKILVDEIQNVAV